MCQNADAPQKHVECVYLVPPTGSCKAKVVCNSTQKGLNKHHQKLGDQLHKRLILGTGDTKPGPQKTFLQRLPLYGNRLGQVRLGQVRKYFNLRKDYVALEEFIQIQADDFSTLVVQIT